MLCDICQIIFSESRVLSIGTYGELCYDRDSFRAGRQAGCHVCNLIWEKRSYLHKKSKYDPEIEDDDWFPSNCTYAFKVLNAEWAHHGKGGMWLVPVDVDEDMEGDALQISLEAGTRNDIESIDYLASLLRAGSDELFSESMKFWLVLDFYCQLPRLALPLEIARGTSTLFESSCLCTKIER